MKKAAKNLRACLSWRESIGTGIRFFFFFNILLHLKSYSYCSLLLPSFLFVSLSKESCFSSLN